MVRRTTLAIMLAGIFAFFSGSAFAAEILVLEQPGCPYCAKFEKEIAPIWEKTDEGKRASLRRVDITKDWPDDLASIKHDRLTPTFVLVDDGKELGRLRGYPGDQYFWFLIDQLLDKLPADSASNG